MAKSTVAIIGLGLLGGSLGLALKKKFSGYTVLGLSRSASKVSLAVRKGAIDRGSTRPEPVLSQADIVVICTPVSAITSWIRQAEKHCRPGTLVTDVGSTKQEIVKWAENRRFRNIRFVGSHPMAGSHESGLEFARKDLYDGSLTFVTRSGRTFPNAVRKITGFWKKISGRVVVLDPARHDRIVAHISHVPHALASLLVLNSAPEFLPFAASGFMDTTRIAQGEAGLWRDIFLTNRRFIADALNQEKKAIEAIIRCLKGRRSGQLFRLLNAASRKRRLLAVAQKSSR